MAWHVGPGMSVKHAFVTNRLCTRSNASPHACQPVEYIVANVLNNELTSIFDRKDTIGLTEIEELRESHHLLNL
ncbi:hypothetical protein Y032_0335g2862 [Ancylostoma ceylanicum]|uniref:Uncharacterized protein n=1 Tax=Ancylostoma ceylanicum TaxID=53326 RepID=A0A016RZC4_9BILA|nr:hypothetical protein Y032_0335g2862 [Ancylostoma ceylanicum]